MTITVNHVLSLSPELAEILKGLGTGDPTLTQRIIAMSEKVDKLNEDLSNLDSKIDAEHTEVMAAFAEQKQAIQDLKDANANGASPAELDDAIACVEAASDKVSQIFEPETPAPDAGSTTPDAEPV